MECSYLSVYQKDRITGDEKRFLALRANPYVGYFINRHLSLGGSVSYRFVKSNFFPQPPSYGVGGSAQVAFDFKETSIVHKKLMMIGRLTYLKTNYFISDKRHTTVVDGKMTEDMVAVDVGLNMRIFKKLYIQKMIRYDIFIEKNALFTSRIAFEYYFN